MDFGLSNEQEMIIDSVKSFVEQELYPYENEVEKSNHIDETLAESIKKKAIDLGVEAEKYVQQFLKPPHKLEYEKTFWPFILFSKKRYIGYKYEFDINN